MIIDYLDKLGRGELSVSDQRALALDINKLRELLARKAVIDNEIANLQAYMTADLKYPKVTIVDGIIKVG